MRQYPREVRIIASDNDFNHWFPVGTIVTLKGDDGDFGQWLAFEAFGPNVQGRIIQNSITKRDFEELTPDVKVVPAPKESKPRISYIYSVQSADGTVVFSTIDRDMARQVKRREGGKKAGVVIMAYAPVKEIR